MNPDAIFLDVETSTRNEGVRLNEDLLVRHMPEVAAVHEMSVVSFEEVLLHRIIVVANPRSGSQNAAKFTKRYGTGIAHNLWFKESDGTAHIKIE